ncbi:DNA repair protein RadC [Parasphingorhabdus sp.]
MELSPTADIDLGRLTEQKKETIRARDIKTVAQIMEPIIGDRAKAEAKKLISKFSTVNELFLYFAKNDALPLGLSQPVARYLKILAHSFAYALEREVLSGPVLPNSSSLHDYLFNSCSAAETEMFRVLFLDAANRLIEDRLMSIGTVDRVPIYSRQVVKAALDLNAASIILVHNHPSGDPSPSPADIALTEKIINACETFELELIDHLIVARSGICSLRELDLLRNKDLGKRPRSGEIGKPASMVEIYLQSLLNIIRKP